MERRYCHKRPIRIAKVLCGSPAASPHPAPTSVFDGEPRVGPWVKDAWFGKIVLRELLDPLKRGKVFLTAPPERATPEFPNALAENPQRRGTSAICFARSGSIYSMSDL